MAQSLNKTVEFHTTGVSYLGGGGKVGKILVGNAAFEFYAGVKLAAILKSIPENQNFSLLQKTLEKF